MAQTQTRGREETGIGKPTTKGVEGMGTKYTQGGEGGYKVQCQSITPNLGLDKQSCEVAGRILNNVMADQFVIGAKTLNYSFNVIGPRSYELHQVFECQAKEIMALGVKTGFQIRSLGHKVPTLTEKLKLVRIELPKEGDWPAEEQMVRILLDDHERFVQNCCRDLEALKQVKDKVTKDFLMDNIKCHRVMAHYLRDLLERGTPK